MPRSLGEIGLSLQAMRMWKWSTARDPVVGTWDRWRWQGGGGMELTSQLESVEGEDLTLCCRGQVELGNGVSSRSVRGRSVCFVENDCFQK